MRTVSKCTIITVLSICCIGYGIGSIHISIMCTVLITWMLLHISLLCCKCVCSFFLCVSFAAFVVVLVLLVFSLSPIITQSNSKDYTSAYMRSQRSKTFISAKMHTINRQIEMYGEITHSHSHTESAWVSISKCDLFLHSIVNACVCVCVYLFTYFLTPISLSANPIPFSPKPLYYTITSTIKPLSVTTNSWP